MGIALSLPLLALFGFIELIIRLIIALFLAILLAFDVIDVDLNEWSNPLAWKLMRDLTNAASQKVPTP